MSDIFDHALDAQESYFNGQLEESEGYQNRWYQKNDPLFYHTEIKFESVAAKTDKAIRLNLEFYGKEYPFWFPLKWVKELDEENNTCYIWTEGYLKNIRKEVGYGT